MTRTLPLKSSTYKLLLFAVICLSAAALIGLLLHLLIEEEVIEARSDVVADCSPEPTDTEEQCQARKCVLYIS